MKKNFERIAREDGRFNPAAVRFVYEGLGYAARDIEEDPKHVSGQVLCEGLRKLAIEKWGRMAKLVLNSWGVKTTRDFGEIVFLMVENKLMSAQPTDSMEDFDAVYNFHTAFKDQFRF
jgi:uncharacterized repeat protein (TIGR04138 family)